MNEIEIHVHAAGHEQAKAIKIAEDATVGQLLEMAQAAGAAIGELEEEIILLVENEEKLIHRSHRLSECGIHHGHHVHLHGVTIIVNTREKRWNRKDISYKQVVELAFGSYLDNPDTVYTVTYTKGPEHKRDGSLVKGQSVKVKNGMIFNVSQTNKS